MTDIVASRDALAKALEAGIFEWENGGGELLPILYRHASGAVIPTDSLTDPALIRDTAYAFAEGEATYAASTVRHVLRALAAVLEERAQ